MKKENQVTESCIASAAILSSVLNSLTYVSKTFSIIPDKVSPFSWRLDVYDEISKELIDQAPEKDLGSIDLEFEKLKEKYIFDYGRKLVANKAGID